MRTFEVPPSLGGADSPPPLAATEAKYEITFFVFSVLPAPDSPLCQGNKIHYFLYVEARIEFNLKLSPDYTCNEQLELNLRDQHGLVLTICKSEGCKI